MARQDQITGKRALKGNKRSHAMNATNRHFGLNLQKVRVIDENGNVKTLRVTAKTKRTLVKHGKVA